MLKRSVLIGIAVIGMVVVFGGSCGKQQPTTPVVYSMPELKYRLIADFQDLFFVDPDYWPIQREGQEQKNALERFPAIKADGSEFTAILDYLSLSNKLEYTDEEKLLIYRQHKRLNLGVQMTASEGGYQFTIRVREGQGERIEGTITMSGTIKVLKREPSVNIYPICLAQGTLIDTPDGLVPVEELRQGEAVWTVDGAGQRIPAIVVRTSAAPVSPSFQVVRIRLGDGRTVSASPGHPTTEGRPLSDYEAGDMLDGALVEEVELENYDGGATYDLLPSGSTGVYRANGILLKSTLSGPIT